MKRKTIATLGAALGAAGIYAIAVRPRMLRWGATEDEIHRTFPGSEIIPRAKRSATMAVTIDAPPSKVWAYLLQMGGDRGGWYSWDKLDNWGRKSTEFVHPEWQNVVAGDRFYSTPDRKQWWLVAALEPERFLCLRATIDLHGHQVDPNGPRPSAYTDSTWGFELERLDGNRTRLIVSGYWDFQPRWLQPILSALVIEPSHFIMQTRQFRNLKRLAERDTKLETEEVYF